MLDCDISGGELKIDLRGCTNFFFFTGNLGNLSGDFLATFLGLMGGTGRTGWHLSFTMLKLERAISTYSIIILILKA